MPPKNLLEINGDCISAAKATTPLLVQNGNLFRWKGRVTSFVVARLKFCCIPNFGLVLYDDSTTIPCLIINPTATAHRILDLADKSLLIRDPQFMVEVVVTETKQYDLVYILIEIDNISAVDEPLNAIQISSKVFGPEDQSKCGFGDYRINFIPIKVSSAILTLKSEVFCLVFSMLQYDVNDEKESKKMVWLILKNEQVVWKEFLLPNRTYSISLPSANSLQDMKNYQSLLSIADKNFDLSFQQILHHKELIKTNAAIFLPTNSQISSRFHRSNDVPSEKWVSILDENLHSLKFASVYGIIKEIYYMEAWKTLSCPWCETSSNGYNETYHDSSTKTEREENDTSWSDTSSEPRDENLGEINFPNLNFQIPKSGKLIGFGIRGGKVNVQITVQEISSQKIAYVFLKRWTLEQYPAGLIKGVTVCFTDVNIKRSKKKNLYFVSTPFTRVVHLEATDQYKLDSLVSWGQFGFPNINSQNKVWGMLDLDFLAKVSILTKCKLCDRTFTQYRCPNLFCANNKPSLTNSLSEVTASARLFVRGINGFEDACLFLKNDSVRKYLGFPARIWEKLSKLSARSELQYSYQMNESQFDDADPLRMFFYLYCKHFRIRQRFHVSCKTFKGAILNNERKYFCVCIEEVNGQRLAVTRAVVGENLNSNQ